MSDPIPGQRPHDPTLNMFSEASSFTIGTADAAGGNYKIEGDMKTVHNTTNIFHGAADTRYPVSDSQGEPSSYLPDPSSWQILGPQTIISRLVQLVFGPTNDFILSSLEDTPPPEKKTPGEVYVHTMLRKGKGLPCWQPRPREPLKDGKGVIPGDVGIFSIEGGFKKIFNLWHDEASIRKSPGGTSYCVPSEPKLFINNQALAEGKALAYGVRSNTIYEDDKRTISRFDFRHLEHEEGAILALTSAGKLEELDDNRIDLRDFISQHAGPLYRYANGVRSIGREEALYIITACIKSESWAIASFQERVSDPDHVPKLVKLPGSTVDANPRSPTYAWRSEGTFDAEAGRSQASGAQDQALFLRGFKLDVSQPFRDQVQREQDLSRGGNGHGGDSSYASEHPNQDQGDQSGRMGGHGGGNVGGSNKGAGGTGGFGSRGANEARDSNFITISFPLTGVPFTEWKRKACHPCDVVNRFLLEKTALDFAISHDDDWIGVFKDMSDAANASQGDPTSHVPAGGQQRALVSVTHGVASFLSRETNKLYSNAGLTTTTAVDPVAMADPTAGSGMTDLGEDVGEWAEIQATEPPRGRHAVATLASKAHHKKAKVAPIASPRGVSNRRPSMWKPGAATVRETDKDRRSSSLPSKRQHGLPIISGLEDPRRDDVVIVVMGQAKSGKSTLINTLVEDRTKHRAVGSRMVSETTEASVVVVDRAPSQYAEVNRLLNNRRIVLVDTPGFNDAAVLTSISQWLVASYGEGMRVGGILHLRDITQFAFHRSSIEDGNFGGFSRICGDDGMTQVSLITTKWGKLAQLKDGTTRVDELLSDHWKPAINEGASVFHLCPSDTNHNLALDGTINSPWQVVRQVVTSMDALCVANRILRIQNQLVSKKYTISQLNSGLEVRAILIGFLGKAKECQHAAREDGRALNAGEHLERRREEIELLMHQLNDLEPSISEALGTKRRWNGLPSFWNPLRGERGLSRT